MKKDIFLNLAGEYGNATITFYYEEEIPAIMKMSIISVEDYDDEIVLRGENGEFVILSGDIEEVSDPTDKKEFIFGNNIFKIGVVL